MRRGLIGFVGSDSGVVGKPEKWPTVGVPGSEMGLARLMRGGSIGESMATDLRVCCIFPKGVVEMLSGVVFAEEDGEADNGTLNFPGSEVKGEGKDSFPKKADLVG